MVRNKFAVGVLVAALVGIGTMSLAPAQDKKDKDKAPTGAHFEVYKDKSDEFRFRLKDGDTSLAISPHGYKTKADIDKAIATIQKEAAKAKVVDDTKGK